jgi:peptide/nickel transport system permease protein
MTTEMSLLSAESVAPPPVGGARRTAGRILRTPSVLAGTAIVLVFVLMALLAGPLTAITGQDPYTYHQDLLDDRGLPLGWGGGISATHWFGVEPLTGRDLFAIVAYGAQTSLFVGIAATVIAMIIGIAVGLSAGFFGGWYDRIAGRVVDVMFGFPVLVFLIALMAIIPADAPRPLFMVLVIGLFGWPGISRIVRGQVLAIRERNFVTASIAMGARPLGVMVREVLPNLSTMLIVVTTTVLPAMITVEAALSFLGVGIAPPTPSWGRTIGEAIAWVRTDPLYLLLPGGALFLVTLGLNIAGDGLRDALDPRGARS